MWHPEFYGVLAEGLARCGRLTEALAAVDQALASADRGGERYYLAELLRIKGELLLQEAGDLSISAVEDCFFEALEVARQQDALFWELRAALSLARLRIRQNRHTDGRQGLPQVWGCEHQEGVFPRLFVDRGWTRGLDCEVGAHRR